MPKNFGQHPDLNLNTRLDFKKDMYYGKKINLQQLTNSHHPEVVLIPRNELLWVIDDIGEPIFLLQIIRFPFSSYDIYIKHEEGLFREFNLPAFFRLGGIMQLGYLVPPRPIGLDDEIKFSYTTTPFHHTRFLHSMLVAAICEVVLARNGFSEEERAKYVLIAGAHDIATPAGGDSVKRVDFRNLHEENAFSWVLDHYDLIKRWKKLYGFNIHKAKKIIKNKGVFGRLLEAIDRICYTAVDCFAIGSIRDGNIRKLCLENPLVMDVWQDIRFVGKQDFGFTNSERLFKFLMLRAFEHKELLKNPYSRALDFFLKRLVTPLYRRGVITKEDLLTHGDDWLTIFLEKHYPKEIKPILEPEDISWKKFDSKKAQRDFCNKIGKNRIDHTEHLIGFETGLEYKVFTENNHLVPLRKVIGSEKIDLLEKISESTRGYYVYYRNI